MLAAGCTADDVEIAIDLKTDLAPGIEFAAARTELLPAGGFGRDVEGTRTTTAPALTSDRFFDGVRIAEIAGVSPGSHGVRVRLLSRDGAVVAERTVVVEARRNVIVTVLITRDCAGVVCPGPADLPQNVTCVGGRCVAPDCEGDECGSECAFAADCERGALCADVRCLEGACVWEAVPDRCPMGEWCNPESGCVPLPDPGSDAGMADDGGGGDAGLPDGGLVDAGCDMAGRDVCSDGDACNGMEICVGGSCVPGTPLDCDDRVACTDDSCTSGACQHVTNDTLCTAAPAGRCDAVTGCQYATCTPATCAPGPCEDAVCSGDICRRASTCAAGETCCVGMCVAAGCDDGNPCTDDTCGSTGCRNTNNTHPCGDPLATGWTACAFAGDCDATGTQTRMVTTPTCAAGSCTGIPSTEMRACTRPIGDEPCRPSRGVCDVEEYCTDADACPPDLFVPRGAECRPMGSACDVAEVCSGRSELCPPDAPLDACCDCRSGGQVCIGSLGVSQSDCGPSAGRECECAPGGTWINCGICKATFMCTPAGTACILD